MKSRQIKSPKPTTILAISFVERLFPVSIMITPIMIATGARLDGLKIGPFHTGYQPSGNCCTDVRTHDNSHRLLKVHDTGIYKTATMTVVADELWITAVMNAPSNTPKNLFL